MRSKKIADVERFLLRRGRARKFQQVLYDARGAAGLAMRQVELALGRIVQARAFAKKFSHAENRGERIVEFVRHTGEHLAHGGEFFSLDELLFEALHVGDVATGNNDAIDLARFVEERAEMAANAAPIAIFVAHAHFERTERALAGEHFREKSLQRRTIFGVRAFAERAPIVFLRIVAENFFHARAGESVVAVGIQHEDQVGETVDQAAREFLLLIKAALHLAALGDVHERAVIAEDAAGGVAHDGGGVEANDRVAVFANEGELAALEHRLGIDFLAKKLALLRVGENVGEAVREQLFLRVVAEHANERRVRIENAIVRRDDVDAFLQSFEEFGEARFVFARGGNVARKNGDAMNLIAAHHRVSDAVVVESGFVALDLDVDDAGPMAALDEAGHGAFDQRARFAVGLFEKLADVAADDLLKAHADDVGEAAIHGADFAVEREGEKHVVERVDKVAVALLRALDDGEQLVKFAILGGLGIFLLEAFDEAAELGHFLSALPGVHAEESDENDQADGKGFKMKCEGADRVPGHDCENDGDDEEQEKCQTPKFALAAFELREAFGDGRALGGATVVRGRFS